ncbi:DUF6415 family natural product biosynthesis protein [Streptomyces sp. DG2A-72]|uniref:DUF6415 family natural product biosynthesis protein n=1 Tax=Streptomyces sp. DG2A-72 TaxID=3051386 RepID=UPI00265C880B|nr:DUF6415 family natural product biosynthesis protein [Streptomyces sp. DG2A-72]MDO0933912.1 DUF6415 family natural product biosynthesis protein [Streptomyces sp. DG2A-72]
MRATSQAAAGEEQDQAPLDIAAMRATVRRLLGPDDAPDALPPSADEADTLTLTLRGHLELIIPEVEKAAGPKLSSVQSYCAMACVGEARRKLAVTPTPGLDARVALARRLARSLNALCGHYDTLSGSV